MQLDTNSLNFRIKLFKKLEKEEAKRANTTKTVEAKE